SFLLKKVGLFGVQIKWKFPDQGILNLLSEEKKMIEGQTYDVIVVGAGSMGMAAGYFLAKKGVRTLLIDAFDPPHANGSHHGDTRITRHAYSQGNQYISMSLRAQELWEKLEKESGHSIFKKTGVLRIEEAPSFKNGLSEKVNTSPFPIDYMTS